MIPTSSRSGAPRRATAWPSGYYTDNNGHSQGFAAVERNGRWGTATGVPGLTKLDNDGRPTTVNSVSCTPAGRCAAGGFYTDRSRHRQGFVTSEDNGTWRTPIPLPGLAALNKGATVAVSAVWCAPPGNCTAVGDYTGLSRHLSGFVTQPS